jgi:hypothetical protein
MKRFLIDLAFITACVAMIVLTIGCTRNDDAYWGGVAKEVGERTKR